MNTNRTPHFKVTRMQTYQENPLAQILDNGRTETLDRCVDYLMEATLTRDYDYKEVLSAVARHLAKKGLDSAAATVERAADSLETGN